MSLQVPSWPSNYSKSTPLENVIAWLGSLSFDFNNSNGRVVVNVNMNAQSAQDGSTPVDQVGVNFGQDFPVEGGEPVQFPTVQQFMTDNQEHFDAIRGYIYAKLKTLPQFTGSTDV